ncbi:hypothetical protein F5B21DRAFT_374229 [Xylaria acuta]|nr:hypothetical protein F5B21DRAFT_374229 [Xylaria acuta]
MIVMVPKTRTPDKAQRMRRCLNLDNLDTGAVSGDCSLWYAGSADPNISGVLFASESTSKVLLPLPLPLPLLLLLVPLFLSSSWLLLLAAPSRPRWKRRTRGGHDGSLNGAPSFMPTRRQGPANTPLKGCWTWGVNASWRWRMSWQGASSTLGGRRIRNSARIYCEARGARSLACTSSVCCGKKRSLGFC